MAVSLPGAAMRSDTARAPEWLTTGVPQLDRVLGGGIRRRSTVMVIGPPGIGKTTLAQQIAFQLATQGAAALYLTGFGETHDKVVTFGQGLNFFAPDLVGQRLHFSNLVDLLQGGREQTEDAVVQTARGVGASLVVLDGFRGLRGFLTDEREVGQFVYSLGAKLALLGATTMILVEGHPDETSRYTEATVCDVVLALRRVRQDSRHRRLLEVLKARGAAPLEGAHPFTITADGLTVFPRFESLVGAAEPAWNPGRAGFGVAGLDRMLDGGLTVGTVTLLAGTSGAGKTLLGLHFIAAGALAGDPALFLGFLESPAQLREKARVFGMELDAAEAGGRVRFLVLPSHDLEADRMALLMMEDVERRGVRRLVIDSVAELERGLGFQERTADFLAALVTYLRTREVTTCLTLDISPNGGLETSLAAASLSVIAENQLMLRQLEFRGHLHRVGAVTKMRFSDHERVIHQVAIVPGQGIQVLGPAPFAEADQPADPGPAETA